MGNPKQKWTAEEEGALIAGVAKHGAGKWKDIQTDPEFNPFLFSRSNIDLKDKWRNMSFSAGNHGFREKSRTLKLKSNSDSPVAPLTTDAAVNDSVKGILDGKTAPKYNALIFEAISASNELNGAHINAIISYIKQRQELPQNFRRQLGSRLSRLVAQDKLVKVQNCYRIKEVPSVMSKSATPKEKYVQPRHLQSTGFISSCDTVEEAALAAACRIAEAESKSIVAAEAVKEAERVSRMAEDTDSLLQLAKEILEKCSQGEIVLMA